MCSSLPTDLEEVQQCLFSDSLVTVSDTGRVLGEFCINIQRTIHNNQPCFLVHANSHGAIDNIPCGTSVTGESRLMHRKKKSTFALSFFLTMIMRCAANKQTSIPWQDMLPLVLKHWNRTITNMWRYLTTTFFVSAQYGTLTGVPSQI